MPTLSTDPLEILLASDAWATRKLLERCRGLSREQFHQKFEIGLGSLHETLTHIVGTMRRWTDRIDGRPLRPALSPVPGRPDIPTDAKVRTPDELLEMLTPAQQDLLAVARKYRDMPGGFAGHVILDWPKKNANGENATYRYTLTRGACLVHVCTHGFHHRAQCLNMLRQLKALAPGEDMPLSSTMEWQIDVESPAVVI